MPLSSYEHLERFIKLIGVNQLKMRKQHKISKYAVKLSFLSALFVIAIFLSSCASSSKQASTNTNFHTGSQGIQMRFIQDRPPAKIYDQDPSAMQVLVEIQNVGTYTLRGGDLLLSLSGFDRSIIQVPQAPENSMSVALEGRKATFPDGGIDIVSWRSPGSIVLPRNADVYSPTLQVTACYKYRTEAAPVVCIDPTPYAAVNQNDVCSVTDVSVGGGQGAPVAVTSVKPTIYSPSTGKVAQFQIFVQNVGGGDVLSPSGDVLNRCYQKNLKFEDQNKVGITAQMGSSSLSCNPQIINLVEGRGGYTFCTLNIGPQGSDSAYTTPLQITLDYNYRQSITKTVQIVKTPGSQNS